MEPGTWNFPRPAVAAFIQKRWPDHSRLFIRDDAAGWVLSWEAREVRRIAAKLGIRLPAPFLSNWSRGQCVFFADQMSLLNPANYERDHRYAVTFFHGRPGTGSKEFDRKFENLMKLKDRVLRVQCSHRAMREFLAASGFPVDRLHVIPIGVNISFFPFQTLENNKTGRPKLGIPDSAFVLGSFQKDGTGWGEGLEPKHIKGPDVFLKAVGILKDRIPGLFVLLSGPARGYVKAGLDQLGVPFRHVFVRHYPEISALYRALDVYLVASREEGGPKAVLESMAGGVPLVSTKTGQAADLVADGRNGWLADVDDAEGLAGRVQWVHEHRAELGPILRAGRQTAEANSYEAQFPLWCGFFKGFVEAGA